MNRCVCITGLTGAAVACAAFILTAAAAPQVKGRKRSSTKSIPVASVAAPTLHQRVNEAMGLTASQVVQLQVAALPGQPQTLDLVINSKAHTLDLAPFSVRGAGYQLLVQGADGLLIEVDPGPERTMRGSIREVPGSIAAGSLLEDGLHAMIDMPTGEKWWLEPIAPRMADADPSQYVLYRGEDVIANAKGICGTNDAVDVKNAADDAAGNAAGTGALCEESELRCVDHAADADVEYFQRYNSSVTDVQNRINLVMNIVNIQYERDVCIRHLMSAIVVRTAEPDPYSSTNPSGLLSQFRVAWAPASMQAIPHDVAQLFTNKDLDGDVIGIASGIGTVCTTLRYCLVQSDCCGSFACTTDLSAHELGHLWNSHHCACPAHTMFPAIFLCTNQHSPESIAQILVHRDSRTCLDFCSDLTTSLPLFDDFPTAVVDANKWVHIDGEPSTASINPPSPPFALNLDGSTVGGDVVETRRIPLDGGSDFTLEYDYQRKGAQDSPESGEDLVFEYRNSAGTWVEVSRQLGSGADMTTFEHVAIVLPPEALNANFQLRIRAISSQFGADDWFVDNVSLSYSPPPLNNLCGINPISPEGSSAFITIGATTDGNDEPGGCTFNGYSNLENDIWFRYPASCTDTVTVKLCDADFNSKLAIYNNVCPGGNQTLIACSDDDCGDDPVVTFDATAGTIYRIRIGGFEGATGSGTMVIFCGVPCPGDITDGATPGTGDGQVNVSDLLLVIASWGECVGCPADVQPDGGDGVVNVTDLLFIIANWGPCE